ncbi:MAG: helix-turn-helix domain-containing protein [Candidatus Binataceae bacterium]
MKLRHAAALNSVMTFKEVCEYLHIHPSTLYRLIRKGGLPPLPAFRMGADYRFNREQIDKWIAGKERSQACPK